MKLIHDNLWRDKIYKVLLQLIILGFVTLWLKGTNLVIILTGLFWLTEPDLRNKLKKALTNKLFLATITVFLIHVIGLVYTDYFNDGIKQIEIRASLLVFPLIFSTAPISRTTHDSLLKTFIWTCFFVGLIGIVNALILFNRTSNTVYLYSDNLLILINGQAIYFALYLNVCLLFIWDLQRRNQLGKWKPVYLAVAAPILVTLIFLLASRMSLLILACIVCLGIITFIVKQKRYLMGAMLCTVVVLTVIVLAFAFPKTINRFKSLTYFHFDYKNSEEVYHFNDENFVEKWNGLTVRLAIWSCAVQEYIKVPFFGTGTGGYMPALRQCYQEKEFVLGIRHDYSPHNQYIQMLLSFGAFGFLIFLFALIYPLHYSYKTGDLLYLIFCIFMLLNMTTEDVFGTFRGVAFYAFINSMILFQPRKEQDKS
ncbi:MAG: O-antigen ligase family protein [Cyclobacteriaceae bacterium]|nr:O-antigen ligase family protein [Cyclobacteriaceae bacterium]